MNNSPTPLLRCGLRVSALAWLVLSVHAPVAKAEDIIGLQVNPTFVKPSQDPRLSFRQHNNSNYDSYIIGPGDRLEIELFDLPELSGNFSIGPDGIIYLPQIRSQYVEGLTIEELSSFSPNNSVPTFPPHKCISAQHTIDRYAFM